VLALRAGHVLAARFDPTLPRLSEVVRRRFWHQRVLRRGDIYG
jgi:hypothetical protein